MTALQTRDSSLEAERAEVMHQLEVEEKKSARLKEDATDQRSALKVALDSLNSARSDYATERASAEARAKRIEELEGAHHAKTKEVLSHEAEAQKNRIRFVVGEYMYAATTSVDLPLLHVAPYCFLLLVVSPARA